MIMFMPVCARVMGLTNTHHRLACSSRNEVYKPIALILPLQSVANRNSWARVSLQSGGTTAVGYLWRWRDRDIHSSTLNHFQEIILSPLKKYMQSIIELMFHRRKSGVGLRIEMNYKMSRPYLRDLEL